MLSRAFRARLAALLRRPLLLLAHWGISPNSISIAGLTAMIAAGVCVGAEYLWSAAILLSVGAALDALDGELARLTGQASEQGALVDSLCDHVGDFALYMGLLWYAIVTGRIAAEVMIPVALFGSVFGSLVRARATMAHVDLKDTGIFTPCERSLVLIAGLLANRLTAAIIVLAVFNLMTAAQRIARARAQLKNSGTGAIREWPIGRLAQWR
jgi:phosphatidylglycerophosphate synthase